MIRFEKYIDFVKSTPAATGELVKLAVERHLSDLSRSAGDSFPYYFDTNEAAKVVKFFGILRHWKGQWAGQRINLEPHQVFYLGQLFGWRTKGSGMRRFKTSFKEVARKNAKTTESAGKALYHLLMEKENGPQVWCAATKEQQAAIVVNDAGKIIEKTPELRAHFHLFKNREHINRVVKADHTGFMAPIGRDSKTQDGLDPSYGIIDEYHAHPTDDLLNVIESGMGARSQRMMDIITTAGYNKDGPCYMNTRKGAIEILKGIRIEDDFLALVYELDKDDDWTDPATWIKANPNYGVSVSIDYMKSRFNSAKNEGGTKEVDFKTKNLNIWTDSSDTWMSDERWVACGGDLPDLTGRSCWVGLDLAATRDIAALVFLFPNIDGVHYVVPYFYVSAEAVRERTAKDAVMYSEWARKGFLIETPGNITDYDYIRADVNRLASRYDIRGIAYDGWNSSQLVIDLSAKDNFNCIKYGQGIAAMSAPCKELERLVYGCGINHGGHPVLRWMNSNVVLKRDSSGNIKIDRERSTEKVDGMVALVMALGAYMGNDKSDSIYNERGIRSV